MPSNVVFGNDIDGYSTGEVVCTPNGNYVPNTPKLTADGYLANQDKIRKDQEEWAYTNVYQPMEIDRQSNPDPIGLYKYSYEYSPDEPIIGDMNIKSLSDVTSDLDFIMPTYGVANFINERALWQKGVHNLTGEPGWFYFKIFFHFKDPKGLFGGIMTDDIPNTSALRYLYGIRNFYGNRINGDHIKIKDRILALARFTYTLSYINSVSPWFFIGINNVQQLNKLNLEEMTKERSIDLLCNSEAIDMRLNTLLDMYRYACYDEMGQKEIIPENLRKFDMSIVIMNAPIKYFQTAIITSAKTSKLGQVGHNENTLLNRTLSGINKLSGLLAGSTINTFPYKTLNGTDNGIDNMLSFQMYTLKNCEIDPVSFDGYLPSSLNNTQFSRFGNNSIKIKFDRCFKHTFNEWSRMFYGTTGIIHDGNIQELIDSHENLLKNSLNAENYMTKNEKNINDNRIKAIRDSVYNSFFDKNTDAYKGLIDFSESVIQDSMINVNDPDFFGNINTTYDSRNYQDMWNATKDKLKQFLKF